MYRLVEILEAFYYFHFHFYMLKSDSLKLDLLLTDVASLRHSERSYVMSEIINSFASDIE